MMGLRALTCDMIDRADSSETTEATRYKTVKFIGSRVVCHVQFIPHGKKEYVVVNSCLTPVLIKSYEILFHPPKINVVYGLIITMMIGSFVIKICDAKVSYIA